MGTWLILNIVFVFEFEWDKCAVLCRDILPGSLPDIYIGTPRYSLDSSSSYLVNTVLDCCLSRLANIPVCANRSCLIAVWPRCAEDTTLVIDAKSAKYASQRNECSTQRVQRNKVFYCNRVLETRAHLSRRIPQRGAH